MTAPTRPEFLAALETLDEGRGVHPDHVIETAKAVLRPIARYQWIRMLLLAACVLILVTLAWKLQLNWPWSADLLVCIIVGALVSRAVMLSPPIRKLFTPAGFELDDVEKAARYVFA